MRSISAVTVLIISTHVFHACDFLYSQSSPFYIDWNTKLVCSVVVLKERKKESEKEKSQWNAQTRHRGRDMRNIPFCRSIRRTHHSHKASKNPVHAPFETFMHQSLWSEQTSTNIHCLYVFACLCIYDTYPCLVVLFIAPNLPPQPYAINLLPYSIQSWIDHTCRSRSCNKMDQSHGELRIYRWIVADFVAILAVYTSLIVSEVQTC